MSTQDGDDRKEPPSHRGREASAPRRISVLVVDRARLEREALAHFLRERAPELDVRAIESITDAATDTGEAPDIALVSLKATDITPSAIRQAASALEAAFGRETPTILILQGESSAADELALVRLGMRGCFPANLGAHMLVAAIRLVSSGGVFLSPQAVALLADRQADHGKP
ncbi:MAG: response regulator transcription factor [Acetobacteraceae bacterium]|nr:response regulator transcription factor [Acetobacteraceae bacterium]